MDRFSELTINEVENTPKEQPEGEATTSKANFPSPDLVRKWDLRPVPPSLEPFEPRIICRFPARQEEPMYIPRNKD